MAQVVLLPGICGTELYLTLPGNHKRLVWPDPFMLLTFGPGLLQLAPNGLDPGPLAVAALTTGNYIRLGVYEPLHNQLTADGWTVAPIGYDWRMSLLHTAPLVAGAIRANFPDGDFYVVAHSMGGLVARLAYANFVANGDAARWKRTVYLGTPHGGAHQAAWEMAGLDWIPGELALLAQMFATARAGVPILGPSGRIAEQIQATVASWPGLYELFPSTHDRWQPADVRNFGLYLQATYTGHNGFVSQARLDSAAATITALDTLIGQPSPEEVCIIGRGADTRDLFKGVQAVNDPKAWDTTTNGDGVVTTARGVLPGRKEVNLPSLLHQDYTISRRVLGNVTKWLADPVNPLPSKLDPPPFMQPPELPAAPIPDKLQPPAFPALVRAGDP